MFGAQAIGVFKNFRKGQWVFIANLLRNLLHGKISAT